MSKKEKRNWTNWHHLLHKEIINDEKFIPNGIKLLIAVSGGQDSMALLTLFEDIKDHHDWEIYVWHGNHQWHSQSSVFSEELESFCNYKKIKFYSDKADYLEVSTEEKARKWRYQKLYDTAKNLAGSKKEMEKIYILTGHTSSDNAETFLLNLARGSSYKGLKGIPNKRLSDNNFYIVRPLLNFSRSDTLKICEELKIPIWIDPTNSDLKLKRNIIRKNIMESLEKIYPGCSVRINSFTQKMNKYEKERSDLCKLALQACLEKNMLKRDKFNTLGLEARSTLLNQLFKEKFTKQIKSNGLDKIAKDIFNKNKGSIDLPNSLKIVWNNSYIQLKN
tara:strand:- start:360 stop:1361 length:1002 start_codon:yes stop_codon:yes gene_type:complete